MSAEQEEEKADYLPLSYILLIFPPIAAFDFIWIYLPCMAVSFVLGLALGIRTLVQQRPSIIHKVLLLALIALNLIPFVMAAVRNFF